MPYQSELLVLLFQPQVLLCRYAWSNAEPISFINCHATPCENVFQANSRDRLHRLFARPRPGI